VGGGLQSAIFDQYLRNGARQGQLLWSANKASRQILYTGRLYNVLDAGYQTTSKSGVVMVTVTRFKL